MVTAELFASVPQSVGNITFTPDNRVIYSHHPFFAPEIRVAELNPDRKSFKPFPNAAWNTPQPGTDHYFDSVLGLRGDENGIVWMLDMGQRTPLTPKIVGWDTKADKLYRIYYLPAPASGRSARPAAPGARRTTDAVRGTSGRRPASNASCKGPAARCCRPGRG